MQWNLANIPGFITPLSYWQRIWSKNPVNYPCDRFQYLLTTEIVNHLVTTAKGKIAFLRIVTITRIPVDDRRVYNNNIILYCIVVVLYHYVYVPVMRKNLYNTNDMSFAFLSNYDTRGTAMVGKIGPNQVWSEINVDKKKIAIPHLIDRTMTVFRFLTIYLFHFYSHNK